MQREPREIRLVFQLLLYVGLALLTAAPVLAQVPVDENGNVIDELPLLSADELEELVGPVALYPDDLLAIVLPASTYPLQIVQAARFLEQLEDDPSLKPDEEWDESVTALLNYPEIIQLMNEDIDWTWRLGEAVVAQQPEVISAVEAFREKAYAAGNLETDEYQTVSKEDGVIEIEPAEEDVIYVPYYEPERVVVYQPRPVYYYHPRPYPLYYYPYPYGYPFASGYFWGVTTAFTIGWLTDHLHVYHHSYWGHPYYGHHYHHRHYYRRPSLSLFNRHYVHNSHRYWNYHYRDGHYWRPRRHGGARPGHDRNRVHYYRDRNRDDWRHRGDNRRRDGQSNERRTRNDGPGWVNNRQNAASSNRESVRFRSPDTRTRPVTDRQRQRAPADVNRNSTVRTGFAAPPRRTAPATNRRATPSTPPRSSSRATLDRDRYATPNRRQVPASRQASPPRTAQPARSVPPRRQASPPSTPRRSASPSPRTERRSSRPSSRAAPKRVERTSRRH